VVEQLEIDLYFYLVYVNQPLFYENDLINLFFTNKRRKEKETCRSCMRKSTRFPILTSSFIIIRTNCDWFLFLNMSKLTRLSSSTCSSLKKFTRNKLCWTYIHGCFYLFIQFTNVNVNSLRKKKWNKKMK